MSTTMTSSRLDRPTSEVWIRRCCALVVAAVAAYSSYAHQRQFALDGGADQIGAALWPLSVDGLLILASTGLLAERAETTRRARWAVRLAFLLGIAVSLAANIAAAPALTWQPILVAGWPPLALLLAVELLLHSRHRDTPGETTKATSETTTRTGESTSSDDFSSVPATGQDRRNGQPTAEDLMWAHYERELAQGRNPTGADLDRIAGTNNYGRAVLARWRRTGRLPAQPLHNSPNGAVAELTP